MAPHVSWLDRAIAVVSPTSAMRRVRAKAAFGYLRDYAGASKGRGTMSWKASNTSADAELHAHNYVLRERARDLVRNNPHAAKGLQVWVQNLVGDGIEARIADKKRAKLWKEWSGSVQCDADGQLNFNGIQALAVREMVEAGEVLIRRRWRRKTDRVPGNMQLQVMEIDHLDTSKNIALADGGYIIQGVEFDKIGRRVAYWLFPIHPGHNVVGLTTSIMSQRVDAGEIIHLYEKQRVQARGASWFAPVITALRDLGTYEDAELVRKKIEACMVGILTGGDEDDGIGIPLTGEGQTPGIYDANGVQVEKFEPGMFAIARGGRDIKFNSPAVTGSYDAYKRSMLHTIAAGLRVPHEALTGDLSGVNYSSIRAGLVEYRRLVSALQWHIIIPTLCDRAYRWFEEAYEIDGALKGGPGVAPTWSPPKFQWVDPLKDVTADLLAVRAGIRSMPEVISEQGRDPDEVLAETIEWNKKLDAAALVLDSDPRQTAKNGALQISITAGADGASSEPKGAA